MCTELHRGVGDEPSVPTAALPDPTAIGERIGLVADQCYTVEDLAGLLQCSTRHVWRLHDGGQLPPAVRIGRLVRWPRSLIQSWIADGCPRARKVSR
jgi:excisionase family DNA binding protein